MAALVEKTLLRWIGFQPRPVSSEIWDAEIIHAPLETLADLPVDFTKAGPVQVELGHCPLKEGCVLRIAQRFRSLLRMGQQPKVDSAKRPMFRPIAGRIPQCIAPATRLAGLPPPQVLSASPP
jgi:hypothetical protein